VKFSSADGEKSLMKNGSGTIVKRLVDNNYVMLTCAHIFDAFQ